jgi:ATP-dependent protease ClpP protease subunit
MENQFKYIQNVNKQEATILLYDEIGSHVNEYGNYVSGVDGSLFASEVKYLDEAGVSTINVRINSVGGNVLDGYSIVSAILNCKNATVNTYVDGLAASIAGVIAVAGKKRYMMDYGTLMVHNPSGGNDNEVLNIVKGTLTTIFKNRTSLTEDKISEMMNQETWLTSEDALSCGMIDEIVSSNKKVKIKKSESLANMAIIYNKLINPKKMKQVTDKLGLDESATEEVIVAKIAELETEADVAKSEKNAIESELKKAEETIATFEAEKESAQNAKIEDMVNSFNVKEDEKENIVKLAKVDFEAVKNMLSKSTVKEPVKIFDIKNIQTPKGAEDRSEWTLRDWEKKDAKGLAKIKNETPEVYEEMYKVTYKKNK